MAIRLTQKILALKPRINALSEDFFNALLETAQNGAERGFIICDDGKKFIKGSRSSGDKDIMILGGECPAGAWYVGDFHVHPLPWAPIPSITDVATTVIDMGRDLLCVGGYEKSPVVHCFIFDREKPAFDKIGRQLRGLHRRIENLESTQRARELTEAEARDLTEVDRIFDHKILPELLKEEIAGVYSIRWKSVGVS